MLVGLTNLVGSISSNGLPNTARITDSYGVRPVISLNNNIGYSDGNGSETTPYVIEEE